MGDIMHTECSIIMNKRRSSKKLYCDPNNSVIGHSNLHKKISDISLDSHGSSFMIHLKKMNFFDNSTINNDYHNIVEEPYAVINKYKQQSKSREISAANGPNKK